MVEALADTLFLWKGGQGGIARTSEYIVMRYIRLSAFCEGG